MKKVWTYFAIGCVVAIIGSRFARNTTDCLEMVRKLIDILFLLLMEHKTGIITKKEKYCIFRWIIIIMRANGQLCFWKKRLQNIIEH